MNQQRGQFRINIGFLINKPAGYTREIPFEYDEFELEGDFSVDDLKGTITLERTRNGIHSLAELSAMTEAECGRCLEPFKLQVKADFEEVFTFANHPLSEDEAIIPEDGYLEFEPLIREYLMLELPINPVCRIDCKGLCPVCGQNLNEEICSHQEMKFEEELLTTGKSGSSKKKTESKNTA